MNDEIMLKRSIFETKTLIMESFMRLPKIYHYKNVYTMDIAPSLTVRIKQTNQMAHYDFMSATFRVNTRTHFRFLKFMNTILTWMTDIQDLYLHNEDNRLEFNYDYKDLKVVLKPSYQNSQVIKAIPDVYETTDDRVPAVRIFINRLENTALLSVEEVKGIFSIVREFNYQSESAMLLQLYQLHLSGFLSISQNRLFEEGGH